MLASVGGANMSRMSGEEILRGLAEEFARDLAMSRPEHQESVRLNARPYLTGAFMALFRANAFTSPDPRQLLEEVLAPIEQPLVDAGLIERVSFGFEETATAALAPEDESDR